MKKVLKSFHKLHKGQGGLTLIELLVVVAILGVLAAIVILNVGGFIGTGTEEAANTEAHQVQTAIIAYMAHENQATLTGSTIGSGTTCGNATEANEIACYLMNPSLLQATYTYGTDGAVTGALPDANGKWAACTFSGGTWTC